MKFYSKKHQSKIMDFLRLPDLLHTDLEGVELTAQEREEVRDISDSLDIIKQMLQPYKPKLDKYYQSYNGLNLMSSLYCYLLERGQNPENIADLYPLLLELSAETIQAVFRDMLAPNHPGQLTDADLIDLLEEGTFNQEEKWRLLWIYYHSKESLEEMVSLYQEILPLYEPYYAKFEDEVDQFIQDMNITQLYQGTGFDVESFMGQPKNDQVQVFVWTSLHLQVIIPEAKDQPDQAAYLYIYPRTAFFIKNRQSPSKESLILAIKALSDPIRYEILRIVTSSTMKNKDIAEQLGTTPANVSFHIQRLINAGLMFFLDDQSTVKYRLNKVLLQETLDLMQRDFDL